MRDHAVIRPRFWIAGTGKRLRDDPWARLCAVYLMSAPGSNMTGIYYMPVATLSHELGCPLEGACKALQRCCDEGYCSYDADEELVFVFGMAREQIGESLQAKDKRCQGVRTQLAHFKKHRFYNEFIRKYGDAFSLGLKYEREKPLRRPSEAPPKPGSGQDQDQDQEREGSLAETLDHNLAWVRLGKLYKSIFDAEQEGTRNPRLYDEQKIMSTDAGHFMQLCKLVAAESERCGIGERRVFEAAARAFVSDASQKKKGLVLQYFVNDFTLYVDRSDVEAAS